MSGLANKFATRLGRRFGLEDEMGVEPEMGTAGGGTDVLPENPENTVEAGLAENAEMEQQVQEEQVQADAIEESAETLQEVKEGLESAMARGGVTAGEAYAYQVAIRAAMRPFGLHKQAAASLENVGSERSRLEATRVTLEGVVETLKTWWNAFVAQISKLFETIKGWFGGLFNNVKRLEERADALITKAGELKGSKDKEKIKSGVSKDMSTTEKNVTTKSEILANFRAATSFIEKAEGNTSDGAKDMADGLISTIENAKFDKASLEALLKDMATDFTMPGVTKAAGDKFKADGSNVKISDTLAGGKVIVVSTPTDITKDSKLINPATTLSKVKAEIKDFVEWKGESSAEVEALETADVVNVCKEIRAMCQTITRYQSLQKNRESELERAKAAAKKAVDKFAKDAKGEGSAEQVTNAKGLSSGLISFTTTMTKFLASGISYNQKLLSSMLNYCNDSLKNYKAS